VYLRLVSMQDGQNYADNNGLLFMETSAKTSQNVHDLFLALGNHCTIIVLLLFIYFIEYCTVFSGLVSSVATIVLHPCWLLYLVGQFCSKQCTPIVLGISCLFTHLINISALLLSYCMRRRNILFNIDCC